MVLSCRRTLCKDTQVFSFFFFNDTATTEIYTLSLHDALPISGGRTARRRQREADYQESESSHACPSLRATAGSNTSAPYIATNLPEIRELFVRLPTIVVGAPGEMEHRIWGPHRVGSRPPMTTRQPTRRPRDVRAAIASAAGRAASLGESPSAEIAELDERVDDAIGTRRARGGQPSAPAVGPRRPQPGPLGARPVPHEVVADHPGGGGRGAQPRERVTEDLGVGLAEPELALHHDDGEKTDEIIPLDLLALQARVAVGDEPQRDAAAPEARQDIERVGEQAHRRPPARREGLGHAGGQTVARAPCALQRAGGDLSPGADHVDPLPA